MSELKQVDWRKDAKLTDFGPDDEELAQTLQDVIDVLGFTRTSYSVDLIPPPAPTGNGSIGHGRWSYGNRERLTPLRRSPPPPRLLAGTPTLGASTVPQCRAGVEGFAAQGKDCLGWRFQRFLELLGSGAIKNLAGSRKSPTNPLRHKRKREPRAERHWWRLGRWRCRPISQCGHRPPAARHW